MSRSARNSSISIRFINWKIANMLRATCSQLCAHGRYVPETAAKQAWPEPLARLGPHNVGGVLCQRDDHAERHLRRKEVHQCWKIISSDRRPSNGSVHRGLVRLSNNMWLGLRNKDTQHSAWVSECRFLFASASLHKPREHIATLSFLFISTLSSSSGSSEPATGRE